MTKPKWTETYNHRVDNATRAREIWGHLPNNAPKHLKRSELKDRTGERGYERGTLDKLLWNDQANKEKFK